MEGINKSAISAIFSALLTACLLLFSGSVYAVGYTITTGTNGSGTVTRSPNNSLYPASSTVVVTATPATGWYFAGWSGSIGDAINPTNIFVNANFTITGNFLPLPTNTITLVTNGSGTIALSPPGGSYASNTTVTATATPATGWVFTGWSNAATGTTDPLALTLVANVSLTGTFAQLPAFDIQPQSITNLAGTTVTFTSDSVGTAPVAYQWFFGSTPLSGSTASSLSLTNVQIAQAGSYCVVATNLYGAATSSVALLVLTNATGATNVVSTPTDTALRSAIAAGGWVSINCNGTITLTDTITLTKNVILDASGVNLTVSGGGANRIFYVPVGITLSATNLTLANGACIATNSSVPADGGAIYNYGTVVLTGCTLTNNTATNGLNSPIARGGAIFNNGGTIGLYGSFLLNNSALNTAGSSTRSLAYGGAIYNTNGTVIIVSSTLSSNLCKASPAYIAQYGEYRSNETCFGGAVFQTSGSTFITNSLLTTNVAYGADYTGQSYFPASGIGGAIGSWAGLLVIDHSQLLGNYAHGGNGYHFEDGTGAGGAVWNAGTFIMESSSVSGNSAQSGGVTYSANSMGGGIYNEGTTTINHSSIYGNLIAGANAVGSLAAYNGGNALGGGLYNAGQINATNTTIALNLASGGNYGDGPQGYANRGNAMGGGLFNSTNGSFVGMNLTIASNRCDATGGLYTLYHAELPGIMTGIQVASTNGTVSLHNTLLAYGGTNANCYGTITDLGFNMNSDGSVTFSSDSSYSYTDPQLAALGNNGGPTPTMALPDSSPAIGFGDFAGAPATDQRGYFRIVSDGIDIGAFQYNATSSSPPNIVTQPASKSVTVGGSVSFSITVTGATPLAYQWQLTGTNLPGATNAILTLTNVQLAQAGSYSVLVTNIIGSAQSSSATLMVTGPALAYGMIGTNIQIAFTALPATTYHLQSSTNLLSAWSDLQIIGPFGTSSNVSLTLPARNPASRFFRLWLP